MNKIFFASSWSRCGVEAPCFHDARQQTASFADPSLRRHIHALCFHHVYSTPHNFLRQLELDASHLYSLIPWFPLLYTVLPMICRVEKVAARRRRGGVRVERRDEVDDACDSSSKPQHVSEAMIPQRCWAKAMESRIHHIRSNPTNAMLRSSGRVVNGVAPYLRSGPVLSFFVDGDGDAAISKPQTMNSR